MNQLPADTSADAEDTRHLKIAVVQPALRLAEEDWNLRRVEALVRAAVREHNPAIVVLPEAYNTPNIYHSCLRRTPVSIDGAPYQLLKRLAREHGCWVSGGYVAMRGSQPRHSYVIAEPDGTTYIHDKDEPSMWEYCYYTPGKDDGVFSTPHGRTGSDALCGAGCGLRRTDRTNSHHGYRHGEFHIASMDLVIPTLRHGT